MADVEGNHVGELELYLTISRLYVHKLYGGEAYNFYGVYLALDSGFDNMAVKPRPEELEELDCWLVVSLTREVLQPWAVDVR